MISEKPSHPYGDFKATSYKAPPDPHAPSLPHFLTPPLSKSSSPLPSPGPQARAGHARRGERPPAPPARCSPDLQLRLTRLECFCKSVTTKYYYKFLLQVKSRIGSPCPCFHKTLATRQVQQESSGIPMVRSNIFELGIPRPNVQ